jgi:hypothetical protein
MHLCHQCYMLSCCLVWLLLLLLQSLWANFRKLV